MLLSNGKYSHVSILCENDYVYEATFKGVIKTKKNKWNDKEVHAFFIVESEREEQVIKWLKKQVGKGYDFTGIFSFISLFAKPVKGKWYCSELGMVAYSKLKGHNGEIANQKISPYLLYKIIQLDRNG
jgi:uncharacterized protein YycO